MTTITLQPVRFFNQTDINHYSTDNRPIQDLDQNVLILKAAIEALNFANLLSQNNTWLKAQRGIFSTLVSTTGVTNIDLNLANNFHHSLIEDTTLPAPSNPVAGQSGVIQFSQNSSTPYTLTLAPFWKFPGGQPSPVLTATASAVDLFSYMIDATGTFAICSMARDVKQ